MSIQQNNFPRYERLGMKLNFMLRKSILAGIAVVVMGTSLVFSGSASAQGQEFAGVWETVSNKYKFTLTLQQTGDTVTGTYTPNNGKIEGTVSGKILRFKWTSDGGKGSGRFVLDEGGMAFSGSYSNGDDPDKVDGTWNGTRKMGGGGESYSVQASESKSLSGQIRWNKSYGRDPRKFKPGNNVCLSFTVEALDPETGVKVTAKGSEGGERDDYYFCRYEMMVPTNRRLKMSGRLTDLANSRDPFAPYWYLTPGAKYVTLGKKAMSLSFQVGYWAGPMRSK